MATAIFQAVGSSIGQNVGKSAFWQAVGSTIGSAVGSWVDNQIFGARGTQEGPRLREDKLTGSTEGAPIPRVWGRARLSGQLIWRTRYREIVTEQRQGGKGGGGVRSKTYSYTCSFAIAFCEGPASAVGRIWADGMLLDQSRYPARFYPGSETQAPDALIVAKEGAAPAFRGVCYLVFEDMPLEAFGNRIPQITAEVIKPLADADPELLENRVAAITLIPASGEFAYGTEVYSKTYRGQTGAENSHNGRGDADLIKSLDNLDAALPSCDAVAVVAAWFGDDLRCGSCSIRPKVETDDPKAIRPREWRVGGLTRPSAQVVSQVEGRAAYGGTPSDDTLVATIEELRARGKQIAFYPFIMMDIPPGNTKPNPYSANAATAGQAVFPWRGRITASPAAGFAGTVDKTSTAATQVASFFGSCVASHFTWNATTRTVDYSGPNEWSFRRHILHYARLCAAAGGVDAFIIGTEMVGLTQIRSSASAYPAVDRLKTLAADVRGILGSGTKIGYAADWSEYHSHRPTDGTGDVYFNLDPLWSDSNIDFIGIDNYMPLADWRDGASHADAAAGGPYDRTYLRSNIEGGEFHAWFYASQAARDAQTRTTITDGAGKPWVFRNKDIRNWWLNTHRNRPGGTESGSNTAWVAQSKPVWFTEIGCPAIEKGANQPNVFFDPKSAESAAPYYSTGSRDDLAQRRFLEAILGYWSDNANNPASGVYSGRMIDPSRMFVWTWDARPYPEFPQRSDVWSDADNWRLGHWLNGRVGVAPLARLVTEICLSGGLTASDIDVADLAAAEALVVGFATSDNSTPRELLDALSQAYLFDAFESAGKLRFVRRGSSNVLAMSRDQIALDSGGVPTIEVTREQAIELPNALTLRFIDQDKAFEQGSAPARRLTGASQAEPVVIDVPVVLSAGQAHALAHVKLFEAHLSMESIDVAVAPSLLRLDPGDSISVPVGSRTLTVRIGEVDWSEAYKLRTKATDASIYSVPELAGRAAMSGDIAIYGPPEVRFLDLPMLADDVTPHQPYFAAYASPWPSVVQVFRSDGATFTLNTEQPTPAVLGETQWDLYSGPVGRWDEGNQIQVRAFGSTLANATDEQVLAGANTIAVRNADGAWEVLQFARAELVSADVYKISRLLRGQLGTAGAMRSPVAAGAQWVLLDRAALRQLDIAQSDRGVPIVFRYGPGTAPYDDPAFIETTQTFAAVGLRPWPPKPLATSASGAGDWTVSWARSTRTGGDDWDAVEVPLVYPDLNLFDIEILSGPGGSVLRTVSGVTSPWVYTSAARSADFGGTVTSAVMRIYQRSDVVGRGSPWEGLIAPTIYP